MDKPPVYVSQHNHFDPLWHRCWDRTYDFRGKRYRSYADVEEYVIDLWLQNAQRGTAFAEGQSAVFRKYMERHPERVAEIRRLVKNGQIELMAAGETISDTNLPSGETLLRNLVLGQLYFEEEFGVIPTSASLEDAFGHSAQLPQLFRGIECKSVSGLSRIRVPGEYWKGLDGSVIFTGWYPHGQHVGNWIKIAPCPTCDGMGCNECEGRGLADMAHLPDEEIWAALTADYGEPFGVFTLGGEESIPNPRLPDMIDRARNELGLDIRSGALAPVAAYFADAMAKVDDADLAVSDQVEANCVFTGCYVTRIKVKQEMRRVENLVNTAERWATVAYLLGDDYPCDDLLEAWRQTVFVGFHDAITGTHMDQPYFELLDMLSEAECQADGVLEQSFEQIESNLAASEEEQRLIVYNSESWERNDPVTLTVGDNRGVPELTTASGEKVEVLDASATGTDVTLTIRPTTPALGFTVLKAVSDTKPIDSGVVTAGPGEVENDFYKIRVGEQGIESILDKRTGREISDGRYLINELLLEEDFGDPWGTMKAPAPAERLSKYTTRVQIRRAENVSEVTVTGQYKGQDPNVRVLSWRQSMLLYKGYDRIDFQMHIDWDTEDRRIRVAFPTVLNKDEGVYAIPYGALLRKKYEPEYIEDKAVNGDWPAVNWVDVHDEGQNCGVALLNTGVGSHKVEDGIIFMSVLRSPTNAWVLDEPQYYSCPDYDGARDAGTHGFFYALIPHQGDFSAAGIEKRGRELNNPMICRGLLPGGDGDLGQTPSFVDMKATDNLVITALKKAERDDSVIVRLAETDGKPGKATVSLDGAGSKTELVNFLERHPEAVIGAVEMSPWKIQTLRLS